MTDTTPGQAACEAFAAAVIRGDDDSAWLGWSELPAGYRAAWEAAAQAAMTLTGEQTGRDLHAEEAAREFAGWFEAQGYPSPEDRYDGEEMAEAFAAGMAAADALAAAEGGRGTLRERITRLAEAWESNPKLTEEGALLRDLGDILRDELHYAADAQPREA